MRLMSSDERSALTPSPTIPTYAASSSSAAAVAAQPPPAPQQSYNVGSSKSGRPKKGLSAYNLFYKLERERILQGVQNQNLPVTDEILHRIRREHEVQPKRVHRKTHGKITFVELNRAIGQRWKTLNEADRKIFHHHARQERQQYDLRVQEWKANMAAGMIKDNNTVAARMSGRVTARPQPTIPSTMSSPLPQPTMDSSSVPPEITFASPQRPHCASAPPAPAVPTSQLQLKEESCNEHFPQRQMAAQGVAAAAAAGSQYYLQDEEEEDPLQRSTSDNSNGMLDSPSRLSSATLIACQKLVSSCNVFARHAIEGFDLFAPMEAGEMEHIFD